MAEPVEWLADGTPYSPRFADRYRSEAGAGLHQARGVFLQGCGLPGAWAHQPVWTVLETGFGLGLNFLVTWAAWRADPARPQQLHFVSVEAFPASADDLLRNVAGQAELLPLAQELAEQYWGLRPGVHRLRLDAGRVQLTLAIGDARAMLRALVCTADAVYLDGFSPARNPDIWDLPTLKALVRCCRRGTQLATWTIARSVRDALTQCGFRHERVAGVPPKRDRLQAVYNPPWTPKRRDPALQDTGPAPTPSRAVVLGGGLAGATVALQLARRGWQVQVLDAAPHPAAGASGLPAGLFTPNDSVDDTVLSQLSRSGARCTLALLRQLLVEGEDYAACGVLARQLGEERAAGSAPADGWSRPADAQQLQAAALPLDSAARWHGMGGWVRPARLVAALLRHPGITWRGNAAVATLAAIDNDWALRDAQGATLASAPLVVVAAGIACQKLLGLGMPLQAIRGQLSFGPRPPQALLPPWPVNGHGHFIPHAQHDGGPIWVTGASFVRDDAADDIRPAEQGFNLQRLGQLLPDAARQLKGGPAPQAWAGVRCASRDRLPLAGPVDPIERPGLWVHTAMGARGLTFALLTAELLVARLHHEPLSLPWRLAAALDPRRG
ncbi:FAD-dependent 5-carboxymethylaminomethyl-2-thiouridine(34) oxidoreductase MnmC [Pseudorhodoferax sp. Leaf267]|uniref:FAD-dependent 5-carboxymethylaminomethyl-2-thiouridine(34) oxidoreductase MnmC n=1 Tax=Pseudorhodoferax sp. Leaf267 TaxID=1736316 RepID=UPI0006FCC8C0|nr:FAD-dependent 5-carboxymethylaminomethyl-2-thiouridine(34) oxidoreductase MnmC [Pseudorhodoferax sp. Leaf267]KQP15057.1 FAD-dependent cmnm(5)s(2)U34 oxidoreductase [Pseudorhodoferax sp. Leaf267]